MKKSIFTMTGIKRYLLVAGILLVAVILLANKLVIWGAAFIAAGLIGVRLFVLTFTLRGNAVRIISLRKANRREVQRYARQA